MAAVYYADGRVEHLDHVPSLEEAQAIVEGWVERVCPRKTPDKVFLCNEEGLIRRLPINRKGCELYGDSSPICGNIIVMSRAEARKGWL